MGYKNDTIRKFILKFPTLPNGDIADNLMESRPDLFGSWKRGNLRDTIGKLRKKMKLKIPKSEMTPKGVREKYTESNNTAQIDKITSERVQTLDDLIRVCGIDTDIWEIERWSCNAWGVSSKKRDQNLTWTKSKDDKGNDIQIMEGHAVRENEWIDNTNYQVKAWLKKKVDEIKMNFVKDEIISEMKKHAPKYTKIKYKYDKKSKGYLLEVILADAHFGALSWDEESGHNYDIKIARELFLTCIKRIIEQSSGYNISKVLFIVGNDFFNVDTIMNTTTAGTPQDEDSRWKKTFKKGRELMVESIDLLSQVAPVDVLIVPGNHDTQRTFYMGDALECWYSRNPNVSVDNSAKVRKYYQFGNCMIGFAHGRDEKMADYPLLLATEQPEMWAKTKYREIHLGEIHHKKEVKWLSTEEYKGVTVRYMRSISAPSNWAYSKGFISSLRAGEAFVWDEDNGLIAQFTASI